MSALAAIAGIAGELSCHCVIIAKCHILWWEQLCQQTLHCLCKTCFKCCTDSFVRVASP